MTECTKAIGIFLYCLNALLRRFTPDSRLFRQCNWIALPPSIEGLFPLRCSTVSGEQQCPLSNRSNSRSSPCSKWPCFPTESPLVVDDATNPSKSYYNTYGKNNSYGRSSWASAIDASSRIEITSASVADAVVLRVSF